MRGRQQQAAEFLIAVLMWIPGSSPVGGVSGLPSKDSEAGAKSPAFVYSVNKAFFTSPSPTQVPRRDCNPLNGALHSTPEHLFTGVVALLLVVRYAIIDETTDPPALQPGVTRRR